MNNFVVDASIALKWFFFEEGTEQAHTLLNRIDFFYAPELFLIEIDAVISKRVRKNELSPDEATITRNRYRMFPFKLIPYEQIEELAFKLAIELPVTLYDAAYIAVAVNYEAKLYTADQRLFKGLSTTPFNEYAECIL